MYKFILVFLLSSVFVFSCMNDSKSSSNLNKEDTVDSVVIDNKYYYPNIDSLVDIYDRKESVNLYKQKLPYPIEDSLCFYFSKLNRKELIEDDEFKYIAGKLLEKVYLQVRKDSEKPESFPVYNVTLLYDNRISNSFALNILVKNTQNIDSSFVKYGSQLQGEFYCIDSVILKINKLPQMQNDSIHQICMDLVKKNKTGGCMW